MAIYYSCDFHFVESELKGAWINFAFDRFFSVDIANTYDTNGNGLFEETEKEEIYNHAFINLENYGFLSVSAMMPVDGLLKRSLNFIPIWMKRRC